MMEVKVNIVERGQGRGGRGSERRYSCVEGACACTYIFQSDRY